MPDPFSSAQLLGLSFDLEHRRREVLDALSRSFVQFNLQEGEVRKAFSEWQVHKETLEGLLKSRTSWISKASQAQQAVARLQYDIAHTRKKITQLSKEMAQESQRGGKAVPRLRRERAQASVQVEEYEAQVLTHQSALEEAKNRIKGLVERYVPQWDVEIQARAVLEAHQKHMVPPALVLDAVSCELAYAHVRFRLEGDTDAWKNHVLQAYQWAKPLYAHIQEGLYLLDKNSAVLAGRLRITAELLCALIASGCLVEAGEWFALLAQPEARFHAMHEVFRTWCFGHFLRKEYVLLQNMLQQHAFSEHAEGAYVMCFKALLIGDSEAFNKGLSAVMMWESQNVGADPVSRGLVSLNMGANALVYCARRGGIAVTVQSPVLIADHGWKQKPSSPSVL
jgi:hypothetical protein